MSDDVEPKMAKLAFQIEPEHWYGGTAETVWVLDLGDDKYQIENSPWLKYGISAGDIVIAKKAESGFLEMERVHERSGASTIRVRTDLQEGVTFERQWKEFKKELQAFKDLGCRFEGGEIGGYLIVALDIPPEVDIERVRDVLVAGVRDGTWEFEEAQISHPRAE